MPRVEIVTTGGTIASRTDPATGAAVTAVGAAELVALVPQLAAVAEVRVTEFSLIGSWNMTPARMADLAGVVRRLQADPGVDGVVVTHGTDTMEETAFALDLLVDGLTPVVLTGAMRNAGQAGHDGPRNVLSAVRVAAEPSTRGLGVLVVLNDTIHAARVATKRHTTALDAFASPNGGPVGLVDDTGVWLYRRPNRLPALPLAPPDPTVYLVKMAAGMDPLFLHAARQAGATGVVIEGSGAGNVYEGWQESIRELVQDDTPVVLVSRTGGGRVVAGYGGPGGGQTLRDLGVILGGDLSGPKARLALMFALGAGLTTGQIRDYFSQLVGSSLAVSGDGMLTTPG